MKFLRIKTRFGNWYAVIGIVLVFILLRIPSLVEPDWYGDEGIYQVVAQALHAGRLLYVGIWDNKPPLLYLMYALFNADLFYIKLFSLIVGALSVVAFYLLASRLLQNKASTYLATIVFALLFGLPLLEGNIANAENFMLLPIILAFFLFTLLYPHVLQGTKRKVRHKGMLLFVIGFLLSVAVSIKVVAVFDLATLLVVSTLLSTDQKILRPVDWVHQAFAVLKGKVLLLVAFILLPVITSLYFFFHHALGNYLSAVYLTNVSYVNVNNELYFPLGFLGIKLVLLAAAVFSLIYFRRLFDAKMLLIYLWVSFSMFNAFFSERAYTHYLLVLLPSFALLVGSLFEQKQRFMKAAMLFVVCILVFRGFVFYTKISGYYENYFLYTFGDRPTSVYESFFDPQTPINYNTASLIDSIARNQKSVFIISDDAEIYALAHKLPPGKYIVLYHILFYPGAIASTKKALTKEKTRYIIQAQDAPRIDEFLQGYRLKYLMGNVRIYERKV